MTTKEKDPHLRDNKNKDESNAGLLFLLNELADDQAFFVICRSIFHHDHEVSIGASLVLGHLRDQRALPYLLRALLTNDHRRAEAIIWALGEIGSESSVPFLITVMEKKFVVKSAIFALGKIGAPEAAVPILKNLHDNDETVRVLAAKALGQIRFGQKFDLMAAILPELKTQLVDEPSRRVKLSIAVICSRLEKAIQQ